MDITPKETQIITFTIPNELRIGPNAKRVLSLHFEHPEYTHKQIGDEVGISGARVSQILRNPRIINALPLIARQRLQSAVSKASKAYVDCVEQNENLAVKEKASHTLLREFKTLDAPTIKVEGEIRLLDVRALQEKVRAAAKAADNIVEAEIVEPPEVV